MTDFKHYVYLAGPISGKEEEWEWRRCAAAYFRERGIGVIDPLDGLKPGDVDQENEGLSVGGKWVGPATATRDFACVDRSTVVLVHVAELPRRGAMGTPCEMTWAKRSGVPVVLSSPLVGVREHAFAVVLCDSRFDELEPALERVVEIVRALG